MAFSSRDTFMKRPTLETALLAHRHVDAAYKGDEHLKKLTAHARRLGTQLESMRQSYAELLSDKDKAVLDEARSVMRRLAMGAQGARRKAVAIKAAADTQRAEEERQRRVKVQAIADRAYGNMPDEEVRAMYEDLEAFCRLNSLNNVDDIDFMHEAHISGFDEVTVYISTGGPGIGWQPARTPDDMRFVLAQEVDGMFLNFYVARDGGEGGTKFVGVGGPRGERALELFKTWSRIRRTKMTPR